MISQTTKQTHFAQYVSLEPIELLELAVSWNCVDSAHKILQLQVILIVVFLYVLEEGLSNYESTYRPIHPRRA